LISSFGPQAPVFRGLDTKYDRNVRERNPAITVADFFRSFPFADTAVRQRFAKALSALKF
jgi:hypothetical protein